MKELQTFNENKFTIEKEIINQHKFQYLFLCCNIKYKYYALVVLNRTDYLQKNGFGVK